MCHKMPNTQFAERCQQLIPLYHTNMKIETIEIGDLQRDKIKNINEDHFGDLKSKAISPGKLTKTISGFANAVGGDIYIGIEESKINGVEVRNWNGFSDVESANGHIQIFEQLFPLGDNYSYNFLSHPSEIGLVLQVNIRKNKDIIKASDGVVYKRRGAQNLLITNEKDLERLKLDKGISSFEDVTLNIPLEVIADSLKIYEFMVEVIPTSEPLNWLKKQLLIHNGLPKVSAVLLYSDEPQAALPKQSGIKVYRYKTKAEVGTRETLDFDPISIEGPIYDQIYSSVSKTREIIESGKVLSENGLEEVDYPEKALHEIVTNAVLHRDYSIVSDIHIRIFDNRVEVESPGQLPGHVTTKNILFEQFARNGTIVRLINKFPNPPKKDVGEGLNTAFDEIKKLRLKQPEIVEKENSVLVIIKHESLASPEEIVIEYLETHDEIHNSTARELTGISSPDSMKQVFYNLQSRGLIILNPDPAKKGKNSTWIKK